MLPDVNLTVLDNQLGVISPNVDGQHYLCGVCSLGTPNRLYQFGTLSAMVAALGTGPLVEAAAYEASIAGGPILVCPVNPSVAGVAGPVGLSGAASPKVGMVIPYALSGSTNTSSVTHVGTGTGVVSVSGTPAGDYAVIVKIIGSGSQTTASFSYSLDGGISWSGVITLAATYVVGSTGLTIAATGAGATYVALDTYTFTSVAFAAVGSGVLTITGAPAVGLRSAIGAYHVVVKITGTGTLGAATLQWSLDGGATYVSGTQVMAATMVLGDTGLTLSWTAATYDTGDFYAFGAVASLGVGTGTITVSGAPLDAYQAQVLITASGTNLAALTGQFQYSLDGGNTFSPTIAIPSGGVYAIPSSGMTITFVNGVGTGTSFFATDIYSWTGIAPGFVVGDLNTCITAIRASTTPFSWIHVVGIPTTSAATLAVASAVGTQMTAAMNAKQYIFAIIEAADDSDADLIASFASFVNYRVSVAAGFEGLTSVLTGRTSIRPAAWGYSARLAATAVSIDPAWVALGGIPGVQSLERDERVTPGLDDARFATMRTFVGKQGFFVTNGNMMETSGGDYLLVQYVRVINKACTLGYAELVNQCSGKVRVNRANAASPKVPGGIDERDAVTIEAACDAVLNTGLVQPQDAVAASLTVDRTTNILSTKTLGGVIQIVPDGYTKTLNISIGFQNPALLLTA